MKLEFSRQILKKKIIQISNFIKIRPVGEEFYADGTYRLTDVTKLTVAFGYFANASATSQLIP